MVHTFTRQPKRIYRYYTCLTAQKEGYDRCPTKSVPAQEMERFIVEKLRGMGANQEPGMAALERVKAITSERMGLLDAERGMIRQQLRALNEAARGLVQALSGGTTSNTVAARLSEAEEQIRQLERRSTAIECERGTLEETQVDPDDLFYALNLFDPVWEMLTTTEQCRIIQLVLEQASYNGKTGQLELRFSPAGIKALAGEYTLET
jgi:site-specific DNA recombinase